MAIATCPTDKIYKAYIQTEMQLTNFDRCRIIYDRYLNEFPDKPSVWINFAELECNLEEYQRARAIYENALTLPVLNMPETVWKAYIDMEIRLGEIEQARELYLRLQKKTQHLKVWISFANFEKEQKQYAHMRRIYAEADEIFKGNEELKEHRKILVESWLQDELEIGDEKVIEKVRAKQPREVVKQRRITVQDEEGQEEEAHYEEYVEYVFPDDQTKFMMPKIMLNAARAKKKREEIEKKLKVDSNK